jgi:hypothetical protein
MKCSDIEILLCEYADGSLPRHERDAVAAHLNVCAACTALARDAEAALSFLGAVPRVEAPEELVTRILYRTQTEPEVPMVKPAPGGPSGPLDAFFGYLSGLFRPVLQPRFAMGMAMTILSFSMIGKFAGVSGKTIAAEDMHPAKVWSAFDIKVHRIYDRAVKYYENLRLVYEIQTRLSEWSAQEEQDRRNQSGGQILEPSNGSGDREGNQQ